MCGAGGGVTRLGPRGHGDISVRRKQNPLKNYKKQLRPLIESISVAFLLLEVWFVGGPGKDMEQVYKGRLSQAAAGRSTTAKSPPTPEGQADQGEIAANTGR
jgi:hypothetical protein